jgi:acetylornithine deacetylase/succinyl-diaminopimelate desuccinylase-like protein
MPNADTTLYQRPAELLQALIRFDTTNPPGNEVECLQYINSLLTAAGLETTLLGKTPQRQNIIARLKGAGQAPPLLLYGHVDVVTTSGQKWQYPPFEGRIVDDYIWGRGALDMKGGVAMMLAAFLKAKAENAPLPGDVIFAAVADEENGGDFGAKFLVDEHPALFKDVRYACGEFGGFTMDIRGQRFYPIMVAEKQMCWMRATFRGPGGHGSMPIRGGTMAKLSRALKIMDEKRLPTHITPVARQMITGIAAGLPGPVGLLMGQLANPALADRILNLLGASARTFDPLVHNTVSPTILQASDKVNVIPSEISLGLDGRLLPGYKPEDMLRELETLLGPDVELSVERYDPGPAEPNMGLFDTLGGILREADPQGRPIPLLLSGVTDARFFSKLGIQTYGFLPLSLPADFNFTAVIHAADERVPVAALEFGTQAIFKALQRFN